MFQVVAIRLATLRQPSVFRAGLGVGHDTRSRNNVDARFYKAIILFRNKRLTIITAVVNINLFLSFLCTSLLNIANGERVVVLERRNFISKTSGYVDISSQRIYRNIKQQNQIMNTFTKILIVETVMFARKLYLSFYVKTCNFVVNHLYFSDWTTE